MQHSEERGLDHSNDLLEVKNEGGSLRYPVEEKRNDRSQEDSNAHTPLGVSEDKTWSSQGTTAKRDHDLSFLGRKSKRRKTFAGARGPAVLSMKNRRVDKAGPMA
jgi:hypothetical protein